MKRFCIAIALAVLATVPAQAAKKGFDIIVVYGEDNAIGYGTGAYQYSVGDTRGRIKQVCGRDPKKFTMKAAKKDPLCTKVKNNKVGFALNFARYYARTVLDKKRKIAIVVAGKPKSSVSDLTGAPAYKDLRKRVKFAMDRKGSNRVVAVLFQAGTTDLARNTSGTAYAGRVSALFKKMRRSFADDADFYLGEVPRAFMAGSDKKAQFYTSLKKAIDDGKIRYTTFVDSENIPSGANTRIFSAYGQMLLGQEYAAAY